MCVWTHHSMWLASRCSSHALTVYVSWFWFDLGAKVRRFCANRSGTRCGSFTHSLFSWRMFVIEVWYPHWFHCRFSSFICHFGPVCRVIIMRIVWTVRVEEASTGWRKNSRHTQHAVDWLIFCSCDETTSCGSFESWSSCFTISRLNFVAFCCFTPLLVDL